MTRLLLLAGDVSGDHHAADFVRAFRALRPDARFVGMGGAEMARAGVEIASPGSALAVGGFSELAASVGSIARAWREMGSRLAGLRPDLVVLVDSGGFNLPFARRVKRISEAPILYYVAPQVWAWRRGRMRKLVRRVDRVAVLFPFEKAHYAGSEIPVDCVGHPLVDRIASFPAAAARPALRRELGLPAQGPLVALLPGSRRNEIRRHLPIQIEAALRLKKKVPDASFAMALAPSLERASVEASIARYVEPEVLRIALFQDAAWSVLGAADVALLKPGSATLEAALLGCPMVVMGKAGPVTAALLKRRLQIPHLALPNLLLGEAVVPELLQGLARPERIVSECISLLSGPKRQRQLEAFERVRSQLGEPGASGRAARIAEEMLVHRQA